MPRKVEACYTCERVAVGKEHAPPKSIFPPELRQGIISVPACHKHNHAKKLDDEYFKNAVVSTLDKNKEGLPVVDSMIRAMEYNPHLMKTFLPNFRKVVVRGRETGAFSIDIRRFNLSTKYVVRALWFHETEEKLHASIDVHWNNFWNKDGTPNPLSDLLLKMEHGWPLSDYKGAQPKIFQYDFHRIERRAKWIQVCRMRFFDGPPVCAFWMGKIKKLPGWRKMQKPPVGGR